MAKKGQVFKKYSVEIKEEILKMKKNSPFTRAALCHLFGLKQSAIRMQQITSG